MCEKMKSAIEYLGSLAVCRLDDIETMKEMCASASAKVKHSIGNATLCTTLCVIIILYCLDEIGDIVGTKVFECEVVKLAVVALIILRYQ